MATVTVRLGEDVVQRFEADDFLVWPGQLRLYRDLNAEVQELVVSFALEDVTGVVVAGDWNGHGQAALPARISFQHVE